MNARRSATWAQAFERKYGRKPTTADLEETLRKYFGIEPIVRDGVRGYDCSQFEPLFRLFLDGERN